MAISKKIFQHWPSISRSIKRRTANLISFLVLYMLLPTSTSFRIASQFRPVASIHRHLFKNRPFDGDFIHRQTHRNTLPFSPNPLMTTTLQRTKRKLSQMSSTESNDETYKPLVIILAGPTAVVSPSLYSENAFICIREFELP